MKTVQNEKELSEGEWVLLFNDKIVDHSANVEDILLLAQEKFPDDKYPNDSIKISKIFPRYSSRDTLFDK